LGQNFLVDRNVLDIIAAAAELRREEHVLEIGPGLGVLTGRLLGQSRRVTAVEKDARLYDYLRRELGDEKGLRLLNRDAVEVAATLAGGGEIDKVVSNLPYSAGSRVLVELVTAAGGPQRIVVTVQHEVAERLAAPPGAGDYGLLSVWTQASYAVGPVRRIRPGSFFPVPEVESAVVTLCRKTSGCPEPADMSGLMELTRLAFSQRRKQLRRSLRDVGRPGGGAGDTVERELVRLGLSATSRPGELSACQWLRLCRVMTDRIGSVSAERSAGVSRDAGREAGGENQ
jgi:16S rRNA (adenine1518-N6/adenine1519-N6)-dimethyltransferase